MVLGHNEKIQGKKGKHMNLETIKTAGRGKRFGYAPASMALCLCLATGAARAGNANIPYYTEDQIYQFSPDPSREEIIFGNVGVSGLLVNFHKGVVTTVDKTLPATPAAGKFKSGQIITGVNGTKLIGKNPIVILGSALTKAEGSDGVLVFDVKDDEQAPEKQVKITIPVLGAYSDTWPLKCQKSKKIIQSAAAFYSTDKTFKTEFFKEKGIGGALACLFLLSTGDDQYLPFVKEYFGQFLPDVSKIGDITWNNGYNGIACAEYYLRTGDKSVLPILQYYCDDARLRQGFDCGWGHWGKCPGPRYVAGGLMNPAGAQVLTTLLLAKECGVNVDEKTLLNALRYFYRFVGHGTVPYGDHRSEGGIGSNGKDGMIAATMHVASCAQGDVSIYNRAKQHLSMSMIVSYPDLVCGHADDGRGDVIWRGIGSSYILDVKPAEYHTAMNSLEWYYDLCRRPDGSLGMSVNHNFDEAGSGAGVALAYTAPLKTLRITGAPPSKYARQFTLPGHLWGNKADEAFLSLEKNPQYAKYGKPEPIHIPYHKFGSAYARPKADFKDVPRDEIIKNVYHDRYVIRTQAAKALCQVGDFGALEAMLDDPDPRVRRAALDGMIDYNYWFGMGSRPMETKNLSPKMIAAIRKMLSDPHEALWVVDGALTAMNIAPAETINENLPIIMPWLKHEDWWLRESAFMALLGMRKDEPLFLKVLPAMLEMVTREYHTMPRERCLNALGHFLNGKTAASPAGKQILKGLLKAVENTEIRPDRESYLLSAEGAYNTMATIKTYLRNSPETGLQTAEMMGKRFSSLGAQDLVSLIGSPNSNHEGQPYGLYTTLERLDPGQREKLVNMLVTDYRFALLKKFQPEAENSYMVLDTIDDLIQLKSTNSAWQALGSTKPADQDWHYMSFDPLPKDKMHPREKKRFRNVTLPDGLEKWSQPDFDDSHWKTGRAPIGIGVCKRNGSMPFQNRSEWGNGEFLLMRATFTVEDLGYDYIRIRALTKQGYDLYLNGRKIQTYEWWKDTPHYMSIMLGPKELALLKKGRNVLAAYCNAEYLTGETLGQFDVFLEGVRIADLSK